MDEDDADLQAALLKSYGEVEPKPPSIDEEAQLQQAIAASRRDDAPDPGMDEEAEELQRAIAASLMADAARAPAEPVSPKRAGKAPVRAASPPPGAPGSSCAPYSAHGGFETWHECP